MYVQIQSKPYHRWLHCRNAQADPKIHLEIQGVQNGQNNLEKEKQSWKTHIYRF